jgi:hypothetical protein
MYNNVKDSHPRQAKSSMKVKRGWCCAYNVDHPASRWSEWIARKDGCRCAQKPLQEPKNITGGSNAVVWGAMCTCRGPGSAVRVREENEVSCEVTFMVNVIAMQSGLAWGYGTCAESDSDCTTLIVSMSPTKDW